MKETIAVIGGGAWGTALATLVASNDYPVDMYMREADVVKDINEKHINTAFLPNITLHRNLRAVPMSELSSCKAERFIWVVPTQFSRATIRQYKDVLKGKHILNASKGIEIETGKLLVQVLEEELDAVFSLVSGPSFAREVALGWPTSVEVGSHKIEDAESWQEILNSEVFRVYTCTDMVGLEVGGALKNVIAVATGISDGLEFEHNARAALITRGLAEIARFGVEVYGAKYETFMGLAGLGDLVLTATGDGSRNRQMGKRLAEGRTVEEVSKALNTVSEGVATAKAVYLVAREKGVEMPICTEVYRIIYEGKDPRMSAVTLMRRPMP
ncbi:MAG: NAD(P)-dependent glycerol-3-phosphate dehydrogenase [Deferribacteraceae bacterium]|jgi:glycerol-3-phosphate dehydrogenase (NAD(P)+)|nr:NAD(P)-dependent glycerol-3-phosphate dehydrogenase [Deferribacteraceae bacterium]